MSHQTARTARLEARIAPDTLAMVKRAAEIQGRSVSDFVVAAAQEAAHRAIEDAQIIRLSVEDQRMIADTILTPPPLTPAMERAIERQRSVIKESR
jgi:uncharacterized protein (DUF1778 family)